MTNPVYWRDLLLHAENRIEHGNRERTAGADERARVIAEEVAARGQGGAASVARELGVSPATISQAVARASTSPPALGLPYDTLELLFAAERQELPPLRRWHWQILEHLIRGMLVDRAHIESDTGELIAEEVTDSDLGTVADREIVAAACRKWTRTQALAVVDACHQGLVDDLPTLNTED